MTPARRRGLAALGVALFVGIHAGALSSIRHNVDEGANVYGAWLIQQGQAPFRDFFYQQPATHLYLLAQLPTDHFLPGRVVSLLATAASGALLYGVARALGAGGAESLLAMALFLTAGLQYFDLLAMPTALMLATALGSAWILLSGEPTRWRSALSGAVLAVSVCLKPIALAVYPAAVVWLVLGRRPGQVVWLTGAAGGVGLGVWGLFDLASGGAFSELVRLHGSRMGAGSQIEMLRQMPGLQGWVGDLGARGLSLKLHAETLLSPGNFALVASSLLGAVAAFAAGRPAPDDGPERWYFRAWLASSLLFAFFVWDVSYHHYHVLYLPPLALAGGRGVVWAWGALAARRGTRRALATLLAGAMALGVLATQGARQDYGPALALRGEAGPLLAFDPTINVLSRTEVGCGVTQFLLPPYGPVLGGQEPDFDESVRLLIECMDAQPEVRVVIHQLSELSMVSIDSTLRTYIEELPEARVLYVGEGAREAFQALAP